MTHAVETAFYLRRGAWHGLGKILMDPPTSLEAMEAAGLDWPVRLRPVYRHVAEEGGGLLNPDTGVDGVMEQIPSHFSVERGTDDACLGVVGSRFNPLQNKDAFDWFDFLVQSGSFHYEAAGSLHGGRKIWVLASLADGQAEVVKDDPVHAYVLLSHAHDGSQSVEIFNTDIRVVCANTEAMARATGNMMGGIRHTKNVVQRVESLKEVVAQRHAVFAESMTKYKLLASKWMVKSEVELLTRRIFGNKHEAEENQRKKAPLPRGGAEVVRLFTEGEGQQLPGVAGTRWAAFNAVTEYIDHSRGVKASGDALSKRVHSAWFGQGRAVKEDAMRILLEQAA